MLCLQNNSSKGNLLRRRSYVGNTAVVKNLHSERRVKKHRFEDQYV